MQIQQNEKELIDTTTFVTTGPSPTSITLTRGDEQLVFVLEFREHSSEDSDKEETQEIGFELEDEKTLRIIMTNWDSSVPTTLMHPQEVGSLNGRRLYLMFSVCKVGYTGGYKQIVFSAYLGGEANDGTS